MAKKDRATGESLRMGDDLADRARNRVIDQMHPGPAPDFQFPAPPPETKQERLTRLEREFLDDCVEAHVNGRGKLADSAMKIIVLRAEMYG